MPRAFGWPDATATPRPRRWSSTTAGCIACRPPDPMAGPDYYLLDELLTDGALAVRDRVRAFVDSDLLPVINDYWDRAEFPWPLVPKLAGLGLAGYTIQGYGCPGLSPL